MVAATMVMVKRIRFADSLPKSVLIDRQYGSEQVHTISDQCEPIQEKEGNREEERRERERNREREEERKGGRGRSRRGRQMRRGCRMVQS